MLNIGRALLLMTVVIGSATAFALPAEGKRPSTATYSDGVTGLETYATSTEGRFAGVAAGDLPGAWQVVVVHAPLSGATPAPITGGSFSIATVLDGSAVTVSGSLTDGTVIQVSGLSGCTNQQFQVSGVLSSVGVNGQRQKGTGGFDITLTHYRTSVFGYCLTYSASVVGTVSMTF